MKKITIENAAYKWFDMKYELYSRLDHGDAIYFYYEGQEYADILIYKKYNKICFNWNIWEEFYNVFPINHLDFNQLIIKWVEDTFGLMGLIARGVSATAPGLKIPK